MVIDGGNYVSNGVGSLAIIYSTADIAVSTQPLTKQMVLRLFCIEGLNLSIFMIVT